MTPQEMGRKGGQSRSPAKIAAARRNARLAAAKRWAKNRKQQRKNSK